MMEVPQTLLKLKQAAELLSTSERTLTKLIHAGEVPAARVGREYRLRADALLAWIDHGGSASR